MKKIFIYIIILLGGCAYQNRETITGMELLDDRLYISTSNDHIKYYDLKKEQFFKLDDKIGRHVKILKGENRLVVAHTVDGDVLLISEIVDKNSILHLHRIEDAGESFTYCFDGRYILFKKVDYAKEKISLFRYDLKNKILLDGHISEFPDFSVGSVFEDDLYIWYSGYGGKFSDKVKAQLPEYIKKDKNTGSYVFLGESYSGTLFFHNDEVVISPEHIISGRVDDEIDGVLINLGSNIYFIKNGTTDVLQKHYLKYYCLPPKLWISHSGTVELLRPEKHYEDKYIFKCKEDARHAIFSLIFNGSKATFGYHPDNLEELLAGHIKNYRLQQLHDINSRSTKFIRINDQIYFGSHKPTSFNPPGVGSVIPHITIVSLDDLSIARIPVKTTIHEGLANMAEAFFYTIVAVITVPITIIVLAITGGPG